MTLLACCLPACRKSVNRCSSVVPVYPSGGLGRAGDTRSPPCMVQLSFADAEAPGVDSEDATVAATDNIVIRSPRSLRKTAAAEKPACSNIPYRGL